MALTDYFSPNVLILFSYAHLYSLPTCLRACVPLPDPSTLLQSIQVCICACLICYYVPIPFLFLLTSSLGRLWGQIIDAYE